MSETKRTPEEQINSAIWRYAPMRKLIVRLRRLGLESLEATLDRLCTEEADELLTSRTGRRTTANRLATRSEAEDYYHNDIQEQLAQLRMYPDHQPSADSILSLRRMPRAWAVAFKIRQADSYPSTKVCPECEERFYPFTPEHDLGTEGETLCCFCRNKEPA